MTLSFLTFIAQPQKPIDLVFAIDVTSSIGRTSEFSKQENLDYMLEFIENVTQ